MPEESQWESLLDVDLILDRIGIGRHLGDVVELGCGHGTFTVPVARRIRGTIHTFDIDDGMVQRTQSRAAEADLANVICEHRDVELHGFGVEPGSQDGCLLFNILHCEGPVEILARGAACLRPGGKIFVIHWRHDPSTPRGPSLHIRPHPGQIISWAGETGCLVPDGPVLDLPPWHFGLVFSKV